MGDELGYRPSSDDGSLLTQEQRIQAYGKPKTMGNPKGNPHGITLPAGALARMQAESVDQFERRIGAAVTNAMYPAERDRPVCRLTAEGKHAARMALWAVSPLDGAVAAKIGELLAMSDEKVRGVLLQAGEYVPLPGARDWPAFQDRLERARARHGIGGRTAPPGGGHRSTAQGRAGKEPRDFADHVEGQLSGYARLAGRDAEGVSGDEAPWD